MSTEIYRAGTETTKVPLHHQNSADGGGPWEMETTNHKEESFVVPEVNRLA